MTLLYVELDTNRYFSRYPDSSDPWDAGTTETDIAYLGLKLVDWTDQDRSWRSKLQTRDEFNQGDHAYVVLVRYSTGSTFGYNNNLPDVMNAFAELKDAEALADALNTAYKAGERTVTHEGVEYYTGAWMGYFESLNDIEIREVIVQ